MLVLGRKDHEGIVLIVGGKTVEVFVSRRNGGVKVSIDAAPDVVIVRKEKLNKERKREQV